MHEDMIEDAGNGKVNRLITRINKSNEFTQCFIKTHLR